MKTKCDMVNPYIAQKKAGNLRFQLKIISHEKNYIFIYTQKLRKNHIKTTDFGIVSSGANI